MNHLTVEQSRQFLLATKRDQAIEQFPPICPVVPKAGVPYLNRQRIRNIQVELENLLDQGNTRGAYEISLRLSDACLVADEKRRGVR